MTLVLLGVPIMRNSNINLIFGFCSRVAHINSTLWSITSKFYQNSQKMFFWYKKWSTDSLYDNIKYGVNIFLDDTYKNISGKNISSTINRISARIQGQRLRIQHKYLR